MGSFDGAEVCELVGLFLLHEMRDAFKQVEFGLYRDDGLGITRGMSGPELERMNKDIIQLFRSHGLRITIQANLHQVDFLDVTLNLNSGKYWPFCKPNNTPLYIHKDSNHPPNIIKQLPSMIEDRISSLSCDVNEFNKAKGEYNKALRQSGYDGDIKFAKKPATESRRQRNIIWFNPPFNAQVKTNIGKSFLALLDKHFPKTHKYHKLFNRNTVKLSYSCTQSVESLMSKHNKMVLNSNNSNSKGGVRSVVIAFGF